VLLEQKLREDLDVIKHNMRETYVEHLILHALMQFAFQVL
jgi:hypothetical protein